MSGEILKPYEKDLPIDENFRFIMDANGFYLDEGKWTFDPQYLEAMATIYKPQRIQMLGPSIWQPSFFYRLPYTNPETQENSREEMFQNSMNQEGVLKTVGKYRNIDPYLAERISYMLGGLGRELMHTGMKQENINKRIDYAAEMARLGEEVSGEAVTNSMVMYVLSNGSREKENSFAGSIYHMSEAIKDDPIFPDNTRDLGLSQTARLKSYFELKDGIPPNEFPDLSSELELFEGFPTVGAEFHLHPSLTKKDSSLLKRLALLNMSSYHAESCIQMSRDDRDVLEVRMNPSYYPVTIANWEHITKLIPELQSAFFTITLNRNGTREMDFNWTKSRDPGLINKLKALGMLTYATTYESIPAQYKNEEVNFGSSYLGQTIRVNDGEFDFSGAWARNEGSNGQLGMYVGYGENLPHLAYYSSMAIANENMLREINPDRILDTTRRLKKAIAVPSNERKAFFKEIDRFIQKDPKLNVASHAGQEILSKLSIERE